MNGLPIGPAALIAKWLKLTPCGARGLNSKPFATAMLRPPLKFAGTVFRQLIQCPRHGGCATIWAAHARGTRIMACAAATPPMEELTWTERLHCGENPDNPCYIEKCAIEYEPFPDEA